MQTNKQADNTQPTAPPAAFLSLLEEWFARCKRPLPWRDKPDPYRIWISEIMLQQTTIGAVVGYFDRFIKRLPDIEALAACSDDELMKLWEGLGYYSRARNLKKAASELVSKGRKDLPADYAELLALPGIGPYTAGAIASIAFHLPCPAVDGNVLRVMARLTGSYADIMKPATRRFYENAVRDLMAANPEMDPGSINEGLMELGETLCLPHGEPGCGICPLRSLCAAAQEGLTGELPVRILKTGRRIEKKTVLVIRTGGNEPKILIGRRPDSGLLSGLYEFPNRDGHLTEEEARQAVAELLINKNTGNAEGIKIDVIDRLPEAKHLFSHIEWQMIGYDVTVSGISTDSRLPLTAVSADEIETVYAVPEAFKAYKRIIRSRGNYEK